MELTIGIILSGIIFLLLISIIGVKEKNDKEVLAAFAILLILFFSAISFSSYYQDRYNQGQIDALKGKQTYKQQLVYDLNDTIPVDTLYIKIE